LLGIGVPIVLFAVTDLANPKSDNKEGAFVALCLFGLSPTALGSWLVINGRRNSEQERRDRLQATFYRLLKQGNGRITPLSFAMETSLPGELAKAYLDERAREFGANFDVDEAGNMFYRFNLEGVSLPEGSVSPPAIKIVPPTTGKNSPPTTRRLIIGSASAPPGSFDVIVEAVPGVHKIAAIKLIRELTGLGLKETKDLVEAAPTTLVSGTDQTTAQQCKKQLEAIGVTVMVIEN